MRITRIYPHFNMGRVVEDYRGGGDVGSSIPLFQNQVYRRVAEVAEKDFSSDPIGRRRLDQKLHPFDRNTGTL
jgi:hypothetical protein